MDFSQRMLIYVTSSFAVCGEYGDYYNKFVCIGGRKRYRIISRHYILFVIASFNDGIREETYPYEYLVKQLFLNVYTDLNAKIFR